MNASGTDGAIFETLTDRRCRRARALERRADGVSAVVSCAPSGGSLMFLLYCDRVVTTINRVESTTRFLYAWRG